MVGHTRLKTDQLQKRSALWYSGFQRNMRRTTALQRAQTTCAQTAGTLVKKKAKYEPNITLVTLKLKLVFLKCSQFYQTVTRVQPWIRFSSTISLVWKLQYYYDKMGYSSWFHQNWPVCQKGYHFSFQLKTFNHISYSLLFLYFSVFIITLIIVSLYLGNWHVESFYCFILLMFSRQHVISWIQCIFVSCTETMTNRIKQAV